MKAAFSATASDRLASLGQGTLTQIGQFPGILEVATSVAAARRRLIAAAERPEKRKKHDGVPYYGAGSRIEETIEGALGRDLNALITRNHYGCLVLNAAHVLFIDVDMFVPSKLYNPIQGRNDRLEPECQQILSDLRSVLECEDAYGFRIYRTAGGFRILATTHEFEPESEPVDRLMNSAGADRDFVALCRRQRNFRARLTPKPWRCGLRRPPNLFPRKSAKAEDRFTNWLLRYDRACVSRATCEYLGHVGPRDVHPQVGPIIEFHDRATNALSSLPLA
jgi:hypothetical protein